MFFFGFAGLFILTQMHGVPLPKWMKWGFLGLYVAGALVNYGLSNITMLHQVTWIPIIEYAGVLALAALITLGIKVVGKLQPAHGMQRSSGAAD
jgi:hypothetical protein